MEFTRPESLKFPQVFQTFQVGGEEFSIREFPGELNDEAWQLLAEHLIPEETFCRAKGIHKKPSAMKSMREGYVELFKKKTTLACFKTETNELVGINVLAVKTKGVESNKIATDPDMQRLRESSTYTSNLYDVFENNPNVQHYLHGFGLGVNPKYRGKGIAVELLKARVPLLRSLGLNLTATVFSTLSSQKAAIKAGYQEVFAVSYKDVQAKFPDFDFTAASATHCKTFILSA